MASSLLTTVRAPRGEAELVRPGSASGAFRTRPARCQAPGNRAHEVARRRTVAGRPVVLIRGRDGQVRVLLNTCTHRGALVCRQDRGNAQTFQCFYHAWTFGADGQLVGVPDQAAYTDSFDRAELSLESPPGSSTTAACASPALIQKSSPMLGATWQCSRRFRPRSFRAVLRAVYGMFMPPSLESRPGGSS